MTLSGERTIGEEPRLNTDTDGWKPIHSKAGAADSYDENELD